MFPWNMLDQTETNCAKASEGSWDSVPYVRRLTGGITGIAVVG